MYIIGINYSKYHDSSVALSNIDGEIIFAASEERFSRIKMDGSFPKEGLDYVINKYHLNNNNVESIAIALADIERVILLIKERYNIDKEFGLETSLEDHIDLITKQRNEAVNELRSYLKNRGIDKKIYFYEHHLCHNASSCYASGFKKALSISIDGNGDMANAMICDFINGKLTIRERFIHPEMNVANQYSSITSLLGFRTGRHEGKITGLAAYGKDNPECLALVDKYLDLIKNWKYFTTVQYKWKNTFVKLLSKSFLLQKMRALYRQKTNEGRMAVKMGAAIYKKYSKEDIAYSVQTLVEDKVINFISKYYQSDYENICLSGGIFSNVKINQKVADIFNPKEVFIFPAMGDEGLSIGACYLRLIDMEVNPKVLHNYYLGPEYSNEDIKNAFISYNVLEYEFIENIEAKIAELLSKNKIVARFNGRMEFGPRALCNRSILYSTHDRDVNNWLNKRLNRTEFMPFAPVSLEESAEDNYVFVESQRKAMRYMTITVKCREKMIKQSPAVVHVDNTARPQLVYKEMNESAYKILKHYQKMTGKDNLVNTSFNMHEEPIVCNPDDACRAFIDSKIDYLGIGNYLAWMKNT